MGIMYSGVMKKCATRGIFNHHSTVYKSINGYPSIVNMTKLLL